MTTFQGTTTLRQKRLDFRQWLFGAACRFVLLGSLIFFGVLYVVQTSAVSTKGYDIAALQRQVRELQTENQRLEFRIATYRSMGSIQDRLRGMDLVAADDTRYITIPATAVVARR